MGVYSIKDLENFTQIKAHTLRIWEQRYNLLSPERTDTNIRLYSDKDLKKILNINLLYNNGLKISKIAKLAETEIVRLANEILLVPSRAEGQNIDFFIDKIIQFDEFSIREHLDKILTEFTLEQLFSDLLIPVLKKIGELWQVESINAAHEHFFSNIIRDFIFRHTPISPLNGGQKGKVLLFLREGEYHELALTFYNYLLRIKGYSTIYLGQSLPNDDLATCIQKLNPDFIFTSLIAKMDEKEFHDFFKLIGAHFDLNRVFVGGYQLKIFERIAPAEITLIHSANCIAHL